MSFVGRNRNVIVAAFLVLLASVVALAATLGVQASSSSSKGSRPSGDAGSIAPDMESEPEEAPTMEKGTSKNPSLRPTSAPSSGAPTINDDDTETDSAYTAAAARRRYDLLLAIVAGDRISTPATLSDPSSPQRRALEWMAYDDVLVASSDTYFPLPLMSDGHYNNVTPYHRRRLIQRYVLSVVYFVTNGEEGWWEDVEFLSEGDECVWTGGVDDPMDIAFKGVRCDDDGAVTMVSLSVNGLTGPIPHELCRGLPSLSWLALGHNSLTGAILPCLGDPELLPQLSLLFLSHNDLVGSIPSDFGLSPPPPSRAVEEQERPSTNSNSSSSSSSSLSFLSFSSNDLTGTIPSSLGTLSELATLALYDNELTGTIPSSLGSLPNLKGLLVENNMLTGSLNFMCRDDDEDEDEGGNEEGEEEKDSNQFEGIKADCLERVECDCCMQCF